MIYASSEGTNQPEYFPYNLSKNDTLILSNSLHHTIDVVSLSDYPSGLIGKIDNVWMENIIASPNKENHEIYIDDLILSELYPFKSDKNPEWIEIWNPTDHEIHLEQYELAIQKHRIPLPNLILAPNEYFVHSIEKKEPEEMTSLSAHGSLIYLLKNDIIIETMHYPTIPPNYSYGRNRQNALVYFATPTPNQLNANKYKNRWLPLPQLTKESGYYSDIFEVRIQNKKMDQIYRYTLNGDEPNEKSPIFPTALTIDKNTVLRVQAFADDAIKSPILSVSYLFDQNTTLPSIHLYFQDAQLFHPVDGLFVKGLNAEEIIPYQGANYWKNDEIKMQFSYWDSKGIAQFEGLGTMRVHGGYSRMLKHKNLQLNARSQSGMASFNYPFFAQRAEDEYSKLVLRGGGQSQFNFLFTDIFVFDLLQSTHLYGLAYQTVHIYFNEKYWGIYNIREKLDEDYVSRISNIPPEDVTIVNIGINKKHPDFTAILKQLSQVNPKNPESFAWISSEIDMDSYIDMLLYHIFFANSDYGNTQMWKSPNNTWHFLVFDADLVLKGTFSIDALFFEGDFRFAQLRTLNQWLLQSPEFREKILSRASKFYQDDFSPLRFHQLMDNYRQLYGPSMLALDRQKKYRRNWLEEAEHFETSYVKHYRNLPYLFQNLLTLSHDDMFQYFPNES